MLPRSTAELRVSSVADQLLRRWQYVRDSQWSVKAADLQRLALMKGWPCSAAICDAEEAAGGRYHRNLGFFGTYAAMRYTDNHDLWSRDENQDYALCWDPRGRNELLAPLWFLDDPRLWIASDGAVFFGSHVDPGPPYITPAFLDVGHYWEIAGLLEGFVLQGLPGWLPFPKRWRLETPTFVGEHVAKELALDFHSPGCRGATRAWVGADAVVVETNIAGFKQGTDVVTDLADGVVLAAMVALDRGDTARMTTVEALTNDLLSCLPVVATSEEGCYTWGKWIDYSHPRYRRRYREELLASGQFPDLRARKHAG